MSGPAGTTTPRPVRLDIAGVALNGDLSLPAAAHGLVVFAHGSGSGRHSSRNRAVAEVLQHGHLGTLLLDLLTEREELVDVTTAEFRFDIPLLAERVVAALDWAQAHPQTLSLPLGLFGASTGAAAALMIQYFINRAGKGLSPARRRVLERAKRILQRRAAARRS